MPPRNCGNATAFLIRSATIHRLQDIIPQVLDEESVLKYTSNVPLSLLKDACLQGTHDEIVDQLADWRDHGLSYPVLLNLSTLQPSLRRGLAAGNPFAKILRGVRKL